jgi:hypothetical protein
VSNFSKAKVYDLDVRASTSHDPLVATLIALEGYSAFVELEMKMHGN